MVEVGEEPEGDDELAEVVEVLEGEEEGSGDWGGEGEDGAAVVAADFEFGYGGGVVGGDCVEEWGAWGPAVGGTECEGFVDVGGFSERG